MTHHGNERLLLSVTQLRWLQEMGVPPALLRSYAPQRRAKPPAAQPADEAVAQPIDKAAAPSAVADSSSDADSGRSLFLRHLQQQTKGSGAKRRAAERPAAPIPTETVAPAAVPDAAAPAEAAPPVKAVPSVEAAPPVEPASAVQSAPQASTPAVKPAPTVPSGKAGKEQAATAAGFQEELSDYEAWQAQLKDCRACPRSAQRLRVLPGVGQAKHPEWFVLGGVPNRQDERMGKAWQSSAGRLLEAQLRSLGLDPDKQVYCSYALKCRADEAQPSEESLSACQQVLFTELRLIAPKRLLLLGPVAVRMVFGPEAAWQDIRGQALRWQMPHGPELDVVISQDPAALLLRPQQKAQAWRDLLVARQLMAADKNAG